VNHDETGHAAMLLHSAGAVIGAWGMVATAVWHGGASYVLASRWPDIVVGTLIAALFVSSALHVIRQARVAMNKHKAKSFQQIKLLVDKTGR
jgi:Co/Zn/Cd efflux system component